MTANTSNPWPYIAFAWLAIGLFDATQVVVSMKAMGMQHAWWTLFFVTLANWLVWAAATPLALALLRRFPLPARQATPWLVHGAACLAISAVWAVWGALLEHSFNPFAYPKGPDPFAALWQAKQINNLVGSIILYSAMATFGIALDTHRRLSQQRELLARAQLAALRLQFEPHFIFNALNAVTGLIREQRDAEAVAAVAALGDLLRRVTDRSERQFVALDSELDFILKYLEIQQLRFAERLRCRIDIPPALLQAQVPDFILQPLVENAIKHGIAKRAKGGELHISAAREGELLTFSIFNEGPALAAGAADGVGLANTRQRLQALYGEAHTLTLRNLPQGVLATVTLPYLEPACCAP
ncbi:sensor histidine kinase [Pseudoduganella sp.]|uniref:sensor histidine kinase n=1 Tax=Pseudoduganella sp. TaxID=1880898 RepID=UPI0035B01EAB